MRSKFKIIKNIKLSLIIAVSYIILISHSLAIQIPTSTIFLRRKSSRYFINFSFIMVISTLIHALFYEVNKYYLFLIIYLINTYLIIVLGKSISRSNIKDSTQPVILLLIGLLTVLTILIDTPEFTFSPVYQGIENFSVNNYYRNLGLFGNPNLSAFILIALVFYCIDVSHKISMVSVFGIVLATAIAVFEMASRTMIISMFLTLMICLKMKGKLLILFSMLISTSVVFYVLETDTALFIRLFQDFESFEDRLVMFFNVNYAIEEGYFDSDLTAGQVFLGLFFIPFHVINFLVIRRYCRFTTTCIFISGLAGVGMVSGYVTSLLVFLLLIRKIMKVY